MLRLRDPQESLWDQLLEEPEAVRLMALWGLIDLVASMVDDARDGASV
jgi:hypothetical protein